mgnify:CR=1 FL=1
MTSRFFGGFLGAAQFLTRVPIRLRKAPELAAGVPWFPVVGALIGAFVALDDGLEGLLHLSEMGDGSLKEPHSYVKKSDRLSLRISHLEPEKRRVGFTQRWGTEGEGAPPEAAAAPAAEPLHGDGPPESDDVPF